MRYRHSHKEEYVDYFDKLVVGRSKNKKYSAGCLQCGQETAQYHNKCCSKKCSTEYRIANPGEYEEAYESMRKKLRKHPIRPCKYCGTMVSEYNRKFCRYKCYLLHNKEHPEEYLRGESTSEAIRQGLAKFRKTPEYEAVRKANSERMKRNNPMHDPVALEKAKKSCKKYWDEHPEEKAARIKRFMQAPLRGRGTGKEWKPTSMEQKIIDLDIPGLYYVGDGSVFVTIGCGEHRRKKNPDFLLRGKKKVIEVGDTEYWHTMEEIRQTVKDYKHIKYECLYLTTKEMANRQVYEKMARNFCKEQ